MVFSVCPVVNLTLSCFVQHLPLASKLLHQDQDWCGYSQETCQRKYLQLQPVVMIRYIKKKICMHNTSGLTEKLSDYRLTDQPTVTESLCCI